MIHGMLVGLLEALRATMATGNRQDGSSHRHRTTSGESYVQREREAYHKLTQTVHYADRLVGAQVVASALSLVIKERELP
jgi:hypothetical protein